MSSSRRRAACCACAARLTVCSHRDRRRPVARMSHAAPIGRRHSGWTSARPHAPRAFCVGNSLIEAAGVEVRGAQRVSVRRCATCASRRSQRPSGSRASCPDSINAPVRSVAMCSTHSALFRSGGRSRDTASRSSRSVMWASGAISICHAEAEPIRRSRQAGGGLFFARFLRVPRRFTRGYRPWLLRSQRRAYRAEDAGCAPMAPTLPEATEATEATNASLLRSRPRRNHHACRPVKAMKECIPAVAVDVIP